MKKIKHWTRGKAVFKTFVLAHNILIFFFKWLGFLIFLKRLLFILSFEIILEVAFFPPDFSLENHSILSSFGGEAKLASFDELFL